MHKFSSILTLTLALIGGCSTTSVPSDSMAWAADLPAPVRTKLAHQMKAYFGENMPNTLPLLDSSVDWSDIRNWPNSIRFQRTRMKLQLAHHEYDYTSPVESRSHIDPTSGYSAAYGDPQSRLWIFSYWFEGRKSETCLKLDGEDVFSMSYYPNGCLYQFSYKDRHSGDHHLEAFDPSGKRQGGHLRSSPKSDSYNAGKSMFEWHGNLVRSEEFYDHCQKMYNLCGL